jgi:hypothetical protein
MNLPKFLLADNSQNDPDKIYIVHTESPKCIFECVLDAEFYESHVAHWIDEKPENGLLVENIVNQAEKFLEDELDAQDQLFNEEFE